MSTDSYLKKKIQLQLIIRKESGSFEKLPSYFIWHICMSNKWTWRPIRYIKSQRTYSENVYSKSGNIPPHCFHKLLTMLTGSVSPRHSESWGLGWMRKQPDMEDSYKYADKQLRTANKRWCSSFVLGGGITIRNRKNGNTRLRASVYSAEGVLECDKCTIKINIIWPNEAG
jgi:hypothetical protein